MIELFVIHLHYKDKNNNSNNHILKYKCYKIDIRKYYKCLDSRRNGPKTKFREKVQERCGMGYPCFMSKMQRNNWTKLEREAIEEIIRQEMEESYGTQVHDE